MTMLCLWALCSTAAGVIPGSVKTLVDSCGFFPQLSPDGQYVLYSPTEGTSLMLKDLSTGTVKTVASEGYPGFDAIWGGDGKVYYVTQKCKKNCLVYRTGHCYDPATGKSSVVLKAQHGRVQPLRAAHGVVINGERQVYRSAKQVGAYCYTRGDMLYLVDEGGTTRSLQPVKNSNGYLWASYSPDGTKVMFEAASHGVVVCDLNGSILAELGEFLMPCWYNDDYIVAMSNAGNVRTNGSRIWLVSLNGDVFKPLTPQDERAVRVRNDAQNFKIDVERRLKYKKSCRRFFTDLGHSRYIVGCIAHESLHVNKGDRIDLILFKYVSGIVIFHFGLIALSLRLRFRYCTGRDLYLCRRSILLDNVLRFLL